MKKIQKIEKVGRKEVYDISVSDAEHYVLENGVVTHNTGGIYSSNDIWIISKAQEKDGTELVGFVYTINIDKSRTVIEKSKIPFTVTFKNGINKYSGIFDLAMEAGYIVKPKSGWYLTVDPDTGETSEKQMRQSEIEDGKFLDKILKSPSFDEFIKKKYQLTANMNQDFDDDIPDDGDEVDMTPVSLEG